MSCGLRNVQLIESAKLVIRIAVYKAQNQWYSSFYRAVEGIAEGRVQSGKKRRLALSVRRSGPAAAYDARSLCVTQRVQLTEVMTEPGLKFNSRKRQVIWARMLLYEEEWVINFCSFQAGRLNQVVGVWGDDEMPSRCHFQLWLVRTSLMAPLHACRTLTIVEHVKLGGLSDSFRNDEQSVITCCEKPFHYPQRKFSLRWL